MGIFSNKKPDKKPSPKVLMREATLSEDFDVFSQEDIDRVATAQGISRQEIIDRITADDEVASCIDDIRGEMMSAQWRVYGEKADETLINDLHKHLSQQYEALVEVTIAAILGGYCVGEYIYREDDTDQAFIYEVINKDGELDSFTPLRDGRLAFGENNTLMTDTELAIKYNLIRNRPSAANPRGVSLVSKIYAPVLLRGKNPALLLEFLQRYSKPYLVGKTADTTPDDPITNEPGGLTVFANEIRAFMHGGAMAIGSDDEVDMLLNNANGDAFVMVEKLCNQRIQKALLGKVRTSDLNSSSRAAQQVEENAREARMDGYKRLLGKAAQHFVSAFITTNQLYLNKHANVGNVWFEFEDEVIIDKERAERDAIYLSNGLQLSEQYYLDLGYEQDHIAGVTQQANENSGDKSSNKLSLTLSSGNDDVDLVDAAYDHVADKAEGSAKPMLNTIDKMLSSSDDYNGFIAALDSIELNPDDLRNVLATANFMAAGIGDATDD